MMNYKGYIGVAEYDEEAKIFHGNVINTRDVITFKGKSVKEIEQAFHESVDDYLDWCRKDGVDPEKTYSGACAKAAEDTSQLEYLFMAAAASQDCISLWFRYLRKFISADGTPQISQAELHTALESDELTTFQKVTLKRAMTRGTPTYNYVFGLNQPCRKTMVKEAMRIVREQKEKHHD